jgi:hypothetical protein
MSSIGSPTPLRTVRNIFFGWCVLFAGMFFGVFVVPHRKQMRRCAGRSTWNISVLGMLPTSQLFEVGVDGILPPQRVSKLSRRNLRQSTMPPRAAASRRGKGSVAVGSNHPANVAAARKKANAARASPTRDSPRREAKAVRQTIGLRRSCRHLSASPLRALRRTMLILTSPSSSRVRPRSLLLMIPCLRRS